MSEDLDKLLRSLPRPGRFGGKLDAMAAPLFEKPSGKKGRFIVKADGTVVPEVTVPSPAIVLPDAPIMGPSRIGEFLMVDIRTAKAIAHGTKLHKICSRLSRQKGCGVVESTLVIDLLVASRDERRFLLCPTNWPKPGGPDDEDGPGGA